VGVDLLKSGREDCCFFKYRIIHKQ